MTIRSYVLFAVIITIVLSAISYIIIVIAIERKNTDQTTKPYEMLKFRDSHKFAIGVKTGVDVAAARVPIQLLTYLNHAQNVFYFSDDDITIGSSHHLTGIVKEEFREKSLKKKSKEIKRIEDTVGWDVDRHKYFPALEAMYNKHSNVDWYMIIDDDTYVYWEALYLQIRRYDANKEWYLGLPRVMIGCANITKYSMSPHFAYGGTGILLSRPALRRLIPEISRCTKKYGSCFGDAAVAFCLNDVGIKLDGSLGKYMHMDAIGMDFNWPDEPCSWPTSLHHLQPKQTQELYDIDPLNPRNYNIEKSRYPRTYSELYDKFGTKPTQKIFDSRDSPSAPPYLTVKIEKTENCMKQCVSEIQCASWSHDQKAGICYLKKSIHKMEARDDFASGVVPSHYTCAVIDEKE
jgi:hypothetical protein